VVHDNSYVKVSFVLCVWMMWSDCGWSFGQGANFWFCWRSQVACLALSGRGCSL